jgi:hypothetical protein
MAENVRQRIAGLAWVRTAYRQVAQETGYALIEFAFALMVLLMLSFGMIDLSRAVYTATVLQAAAQMGARAGVVDITAVTPAVHTRLIGLDLNQAQIAASLTSDERIEVEVTYQFTFITPFLAQIVGGTVELSGQASMLTD